MLNKILVVIILSINIINVFAQEKFTLSGTITDEKNGEFMIGATLYVVSLKTGTTSNEYGFYSLTIPEADTLTLIYSYIGYKPVIKKVHFNSDYSINVQLSNSGIEIDEVFITANKSNLKNIEKAQMGIIDVPIETIKNIPAVFGESDILKAIQLLPGVQSGNEGTTGFYVRGGNADQNLVQLDEATVYNPNHLFGLFSTFNPRAINSVELIRGSFPAQYGGRLSSILDIKMKEGNKNNYEVQGGLGLISSQLTIEGPIKKQKASFIVTGRRTYLDLLVKQFLNKGIQTRYHFYDLNAKINWQITQKDRIFLSGFLGNDDALYKEVKGISYGILFENSTATLRWNHIFNQKVFTNTSLIYNTYLQNISTIQDNYFSQTYSGINDISGKTELQYYPNPNHSIKTGAVYTSHRFLSLRRSETLPGNKGVPTLNVNKIPASYFHEFALYINDEYKIYDNISVNYGLRAPGFISSNVNYMKLEPRATIKIKIDSTSSAKVSYTMMNQYLHLVPASTAALPTDIWIPSTRNTKPQNSSQYAVGYFRNFHDNRVESSIEIYYKDMNNQVLFEEGNRTLVLTNSDSGLVYGKGVSYGAELFVRKNTGRLTGWVSYTLSWTNQQFEDLNFGKEFPFKYDRRHVLSTTANYKLSKKWAISAVFVLNSGGTYTVPTGRFSSAYAGSIFEGSYFIYEGRNNVRFKPYHRLDISVARKMERRLFKKPFISELILGVYNLYSRQNPYFFYFYVDASDNQPKARQVSLLPIIPSFTYTFKF